MNQINIKKTIYHLKHRYATMNNIVLAVALLVAAGWAWGSISTMQRNYALQKDLDAKQRELRLTTLEVETLEYQQSYYQSDEYRELAARERLGLAAPGEKVLLLPPNSPGVKESEARQSARPVDGSAPSNFEQWLNFLFGGSAEQLQK